MGKGANRNNLCRCGSGKKIKNCTCKLSKIDRMFPNGRVLNFGDGAFFHVLGIFDTKQYEQFKDGEEMKYAPFYSPEQIKRMINPTAAHDILLKKQADSIVDNMRVSRVFYNRYNRSADWDYDHVIDDSLFDTFKNFITNDDIFDSIKNIPCGMTYDSDPNGQCIKTEFGNIIIISAILKEFLYYINLFYLGISQQDKIPLDVTRHALVLSIRIMLQKEALDFELDPRGEIPFEIDDILNAYTMGELFFVIAHEYSHSLLNHLDDRNIIESEDNYVYYNQSQLQEFEADINAINILKIFMSEEAAIVHAVNFFTALDLFEQAKEQISPSMGHIKTHPDSKDRIIHLHKNFPDTDMNVERKIAANDMLKKVLMNLISTEFELFDMYGSVYLGQWHKINKIDRVDY